jgi:hypothetical protein
LIAGTTLIITFILVSLVFIFSEHSEIGQKLGFWVLVVSCSYFFVNFLNILVLSWIANGFLNQPAPAGDLGQPTPDQSGINGDLDKTVQRKKPDIKTKTSAVPIYLVSG